ncbi:hypothetical protein MFRU_063g00250 [Monilinia fructicola]|nr:hypothetical protein MFRU_063g00250 [Monilinia fructicola]
MRSTRRSASQSKDKEITESQQVSVSFPAYTPLKSPSPLVVTDPFLTSSIEVKQETNENGTSKGNMASWKVQKVKQEYDSEGGKDESETVFKDLPEPEGKPEERLRKSKKNDGDEVDNLDDKTRIEEIKNANDEGEEDRGRSSKNSPLRRKLTKSDGQSSPAPIRAPAREFRQGTRSSARQKKRLEDANEEKKRQEAEKGKNGGSDEDDEKFDIKEKPAPKKSNEDAKKGKARAKFDDSAKKAKQ